jgi:hypothetical protein
VVWPQNHSNGFHRFGLKTGGDGFWRVGLKTRCDGFLQFGLKIDGDGFSRPQNQRSVSWLSLKTKVVGGFLVWSSKSSGLRFIGCATKPMEEVRRGTRIEI